MSQQIARTLGRARQPAALVFLSQALEIASQRDRIETVQLVTSTLEPNASDVLLNDVCAVMMDNNVQNAALNAIRNHRQSQPPGGPNILEDEEWSVVSDNGEVNIETPGISSINNAQALSPQEPSNQSILDTLEARLQSAIEWVLSVFQPSRPTLKQQHSVSTGNAGQQPSATSIAAHDNENEPGAPQINGSDYNSSEYLMKVICFAYVSTLLLSAKVYHPNLADQLTQKFTQWIASKSIVS